MKNVPFTINIIKTTLLFLCQILDHLLTVLAEVGIDVGHMHPVDTARMLPDELVEGQVLADVLKHGAPERHISLDVDVSRLTLHVLRVFHTAHLLVQRLAAIAAADLNGSLHRHPQRLQHVGTEIHKVDQVLRARTIVDAVFFGGLRGRQFLYRKVH